VGQDHIVADVAVVADMGADHEKPAIADASGAAAVLGPKIHGHVLADIATGTDLEPGRSAAVLDRLRRRAERSERIDLGARTDRGVAGYVHMGTERAPLADGDVRTDHAIGADRHLRPDRRSVGNAGSWIDRGLRSHRALPGLTRPRPRRRLPPRPRPDWRRALRRDTTTCSFSAPSWSCGTRSCRRARPACETWPGRW